MDTYGFEKDGCHFYRFRWRKDDPVLYLFLHRSLNLKQGSICPVI